LKSPRSILTHGRSHDAYPRSCDPELELYLVFSRVPAKEPEKPAKPAELQDPKTSKISIGTEVTIEFQKEKNQVVGIFIAGGSDTPMVSALDLRNLLRSFCTRFAIDLTRFLRSR